MSDKRTEAYLFADVFARELEEVKRRRSLLKVDASALREGADPSCQLGLIGLALSGGGIRSATFGLGVIQGLAHRDLLRNVDYLSTVSGGGYIGSCLSSLLNDEEGDPYEPGRFSLRKDLGESETETLIHLRNSSNYLSAGGLLGGLRLPALILRGILINVLLFLPYIMIAALVTKLAFYFDVFSHRYFVAGSFVIGALFLFLAVTFPLVSRLFRGKFQWGQRNRYEALLTSVMGFAIAIAALVPVLLAVDQFLHYFGIDAEGVANASFGSLGSLEVWVVTLIVLFSLIIVAIGSKTVSDVGGKIVLYVVGVLGPCALFALYLIFCTWIVDTRYLASELVEELDRAEVVEASRRLAIGESSRLRVELESKLRLGEGSGEHLGFYRYEVWGYDVPETWVITLPAKSKVKSIMMPWRHLTVSLDSGNDRFKFDDSLNINPFDEPREWIFTLMLVFLLVVNRSFLDVNVTSVHGFYRDRLSKAYLTQSCADGSLLPNDKLKLSELNREGTAAPYHLINTALNLQGSEEPDLRGRNAELFVFSKCFTGSERTAYCRTRDLESVDDQLNLGTAMAISAGAAAPNMGTVTIKPLVFVMTMLNIRLGYWLPNPRWVSSSARIDFAGPSYLLREALGLVDEKRRRVNVSDGGHVENLGVYELLRRQCKLVIAVDAEGDRWLSFGSLIQLIRYAKIDMGITITIDLGSIQNGESHIALGKIQYTDREDGVLLYIKASVTGDENLYVSKYAVEHDDFPHQSTADQFFDETQFEAYRALGEHIAEDLPWPA